MSNENLLDQCLASPAELDRIAALSANCSAPLPERVPAFVAAVQATSILDQPLPASIGTALADAALVQAALAAGKASSVVAALHQWVPSSEGAAARAATIRLVLASPARGINVAHLALSIGNHARALALAVDDFGEHIAPRLTNVPDPIVGAWLAFYVEAPEPVRRELLAMLAPRGDDLLRHLRPEQRAKLSPPKRTFDLRTLSRASSSGDLASIREYLDGGGDPNAGEARSGIVILHDAAYFKQPAIVRALLEAGANPNPYDRDGRGPLQLSLDDPPQGPIAMVVGGNFQVRELPEARRDRESQLEIVKLLLDAGAEVNPPLSNALLFALPLSVASKRGDVELVKLLLARGADPNRGSPLVEAVNHGHANVVSELLAAGASPNQRQRGGATALLRAVDAVGVVVSNARLAAEALGEPFGDVHRASIETRMRVIARLLLEAGADRWLGDDSGRVPLAAAEQKGDTHLIQLLAPKTTESVRTAMLKAVDDALQVAKLLEGSGNSDPRIAIAIDVAAYVLRTHGPQPNEPVATYVERMIAWSRDIISRQGISPDLLTASPMTDVFARMRYVAL